MRVNENFDKLVNKAKNAIKPWFFNGLTIYGRILLMKSLICSLLQYVGQVHIIPAKHIKILMILHRNL